MSQPGSLRMRVLRTRRILTKPKGGEVQGSKVFLFVFVGYAMLHALWRCHFLHNMEWAIQERRISQ